MKLTSKLVMLGIFLLCVNLRATIIEDESCPFVNKDGDISAEIEKAVAPYRTKCAKKAEETSAAATKVTEQMQADIMKEATNSFNGLITLKPNCFNFRKVLLKEYHVMQTWARGTFPENYAVCNTVEKVPECVLNTYQQLLQNQSNECQSGKAQDVFQSKQELADQTLTAANSAVTNLLNLSGPECAGEETPEAKNNLLLSVVRIASLAAKFEPISAASSIGVTAAAGILSAILTKEKPKAEGAGPVYRPDTKSELLFDKISCLNYRFAKNLLHCDARRNNPALTRVKPADPVMEKYVDDAKAKDGLSLAKFSDLIEHMGERTDTQLRNDFGKMLDFMNSFVPGLEQKGQKWSVHLGEIANGMMEMGQENPTKLKPNEAFVKNLDDQGIKESALLKVFQTGKRLRDILDAFAVAKTASRTDGAVEALRKFRDVAAREHSLDDEKKLTASPFNFLGVVEQYWTVKLGSQNPVSHYLRDRTITKANSAPPKAQNVPLDYAMAVKYGEFFKTYQPFLEGRLKSYESSIRDDYQFGDNTKKFFRNLHDLRTHDGDQKPRAVNDTELAYREDHYKGLAQMCLFLGFPLTVDAESLAAGKRPPAIRPELDTYQKACGQLSCVIPILSKKNALNQDQYCGELCKAMLNFPNKIKEMNKHLAENDLPCVAGRKAK